MSSIWIPPAVGLFLTFGIKFQDSIVLQSVFTNAREKLSKEWEDDEEAAENEPEEPMEEDEPITTTPTSSR